MGGAPWPRPAPGRPHAVDDQHVFALLDPHAAGLRPPGHGVDPVAFLDPQLLDAAHHRRPSAKAATTDRIGYSSIMLAARSGGTSMPFRSGENRTRRSATGSPPSSRGFSKSIGAHLDQRQVKPVAGQVQRHPRHPDVRSLDDQRRRRPGRRPRTDRAAPPPSAAAIRAGRPGVMTWPSGKSSTVRSAPKPTSMRSEWSRVGSLLDHHRLARRVQPGQQHRGFHLRAGDRQSHSAPAPDRPRPPWSSAGARPCGHRPAPRTAPAGR
jgi:hypothetical protein